MKNNVFKVTFSLHVRMHTHALLYFLSYFLFFVTHSLTILMPEVSTFQMNLRIDLLFDLVVLSSPSAPRLGFLIYSLNIPESGKKASGMVRMNDTQISVVASNKS